jgi:hypothetical protein
MANGSRSFVRTRRIPLVSSLAAAIPDIGVDTADHRLDDQHCPHLHHVALPHAWASVGRASWLGHDRGIWMRGRSRNRWATLKTDVPLKPREGLNGPPSDYDSVSKRLSPSSTVRRLKISLEDPQ